MRRPLHRLMGCALALAWCFAPAGAAPPAGEYQVKAAYLFNFGQFVEWPPGAYPSPTAPFVIGIVGDDPFGSMLDEVVRGETIGGHPLQVRRFRRVEDLTPCNILFIARSEAQNLEQTLRSLRGRHVLTVTDASGAGSREAIIVLLTENNRVRMRINLASARANALVISSKLLRPAEVIDAGGGS